MISTLVKINPSQIVIGTANLNNNYGINCKSLNRKDFEKIIQVGLDLGIEEIDTAEDYNNSLILSDILKNNTTKLKINTKIKINLSNGVKKEFDLIQKKIENMTFTPNILFIHNQEFLTNRNDYFFFKDNLKKTYPEIKLGVSIYDKDILIKLLKLDENLIFQYPLNPLIEDYTQLTNTKLINYCRSIFLQGLLLQKINFGDNSILISIKKKFNSKLKDLKINKFDYLISYASIRSKSNKIVIGLDNIKQLKKIFSVDLIDINEINFNLSEIEKQNCDPRKWS